MPTVSRPHSTPSERAQTITSSDPRPTPGVIPRHWRQGLETLGWERRPPLYIPRLGGGGH